MNKATRTMTKYMKEAFNAIKYTEILSDVIDGRDMKSVRKDLVEINTKYSRDMVEAIDKNDLTLFIALLTASVKFEANMNSRECRPWVDRTIDRKQKVTNLMSIHEMTEVQALALLTRREERLNNPYFATYISQAHGAFII